MLRFSLYAVTQPRQFTIFMAEHLANQFDPSRWSPAICTSSLPTPLSSGGI
jgi:hypothetical protein